MFVGALIDVDYYQGVVGDDDNDNFSEICNGTEDFGHYSEGDHDNFMIYNIMNINMNMDMNIRFYNYRYHSHHSNTKCLR